MHSTEIICLANSRKHSGRCIAGLRLDGGGWVRPVAPTYDGTLAPAHLRMSNAPEPRVLDVLRVPLAMARPSRHQPENWVIGPEPWSLVETPADIVQRKTLAAIQTSPACSAMSKTGWSASF